MYTGKLREDKWRQLECAVLKQKSLLTNIKKQSEDAVLASYGLSEMIAKTSRPFIESAIIKGCMLKAAGVLCSEKKVLKALVLQQILLPVVG